MVIMRVPKDLDDRDVVSRMNLGRALRTRREDGGLSTVDVADTLGVTAVAVRALELRTSWEARTIMRYARANTWRIEWFLVDLVVPDDDDIMAVIYDAASQGHHAPEQVDKNHWRRVCNDLRRIRRHTHSAVAMAGLLGVKENAVHYWEANPDGSSVISAQRHARALGGHLGWRLHPARPAPVQTRRVR